MHEIALSSTFHSARRGMLLLASGFLAALTACGGSDRGTGATPIVEDSAGVRIVTNPGTGVWEAEEGWRLEERIRIGVESGEPELQFGSVAGIDADEEGRIYVLDAQARQIRVFDPDGGLISAFGRSGGGPGELSAGLAQPPGGLLLDSEGAIVVPDMGNQRIARFSETGEALESASISLDSGIPLTWSRSGDRTIHYQARRMQLPNMPTQDAEPTDVIMRLAAGASEGEPVLTLPSGETISMTAGGVPEIRMFAPETVWAVLEDGRIVTGSNAEYSLSLRSSEGEMEAIVRRSVERRPVTERNESELRAVFADAWEDAGLPPQAIGQLMGAIQFEPLWPALAQLLAGPEGTLWVQRVDPDASFDDLTLDALQAGRFGSPGWDVFDSTGAYLGVVEMPSGISPIRFVGDDLYGVHRDDFEVQRVVRLRLIRGTG